MLEQLKGFAACERGQVLLQADDGDFNSYINLPGGGYLEITYRQGNYPCLNVAAIDISAEELAKHINEKCQGMHARKANLGGLNLNGDGYIRDPDEEDESDEQGIND
jgi:hypothetical protein